MSRYVSAKEAGELVGYTDTYIHYLGRRGLIGPVEHDGKRALFDADEVERYFDEKERKQTDDATISAWEATILFPIGSKDFYAKVKDLPKTEKGRYDRQAVLDLLDRSLPRRSEEEQMIERNARRLRSKRAWENGKRKKNRAVKEVSVTDPEKYAPKKKAETVNLRDEEREYLLKLKEEYEEIQRRGEAEYERIKARLRTARRPTNAVEIQLHYDLECSLGNVAFQVNEARECLRSINKTLGGEKNE